MTTILVVIGILLLFSAFFSASETAIFTANIAKLKNDAHKGNRTAKAVLHLLNNRNRTMGSILLGNNLVNILASTLAGSVMYELVGDAGIAIATGVMTLLIFVFAEVFPKFYSLQFANRIVMIIVWPLLPFVYVLSPIVYIFDEAVLLTYKLFHIRDRWRTNKELDELREVIEQYKHISKYTDEGHMLDSVLNLQDQQIDDVMTHRSNVIFLDMADPIKENLEKALQAPYSRFPVFQDDKVIGILHIHTVARYLSEQDTYEISTNDFLKMLQAPWFVYQDTPVYNQLSRFKNRRQHLVIVIDRDKVYRGIVTLEDILEEIVGDVEDEYDAKKQIQWKNNTYIFPAETSIREINRLLNTQFPDEAYNTLGGLLVYESKSIPQKNQQYEFFEHIFTVLEATKRQMVRIGIMPRKKYV